MTKRQKFINSCEISARKTYNLGGYNQKVLIEGRYAQNPIVIYLHGGPGNPIPFGEGCSGLFPELEERFTMVYWDQLGSGINDAELDKSICVNDYVNMTVDLIKAVHEDYPDRKICLFGVSWGSVLAARASCELPELIYRTMVYGQITKNLFYNDEVTSSLDKSTSEMKSGDKSAFKKLKESPDRTDENTALIAKLIKKYTHGYHNPNGGKTPTAKIALGIMTSPDYTFKDFKAVFNNGTRRNPAILRELMDIDMRETLSKISIPYLIVQGSTDIVTSTNTIRDYLKEHPNEYIRLEVIENSGHMPGGKAMEYLVTDGLKFIAEG